MKHQLGKNPSTFPKPCYGPVHPSAYHLWPLAVLWPGCCPPPSGPDRYSTPRLPAGLLWWSDLHWAKPRNDCWAAAVDLETKGSTWTKKTRNKVWRALSEKILYLKPTILSFKHTRENIFELEVVNHQYFQLLKWSISEKNYGGVNLNSQNCGTQWLNKDRALDNQCAICIAHCEYPLCPNDSSNCFGLRCLLNLSDMAAAFEMKSVAKGGGQVIQS